MAYDLYPAVDPSYNFPPEVRAALAASTELRNTVVPMTTTLRNNLTAPEKWDGRLILNTTTDRLERWDAGLAGWQQIADILDLAPYTAALLQRPGRNRIINGDFSVNQRAFTTTSTNAIYGLDRWQLGCSGGTATYSIGGWPLGDPTVLESPANYARIVTSGQAVAGDYATLSQPIESVRTLSGETVTVSFWARASSGTPKVAVALEQFFGTGGSPSADVYTFANQVTLTTTFARYSVTVAVPSISGKTLGTALNDYLRLRLWTSAGSTYNARTGSLGIQSATIDFWGVQVEKGSVATPFEVEEYGTNLRRCQRYYWACSNIVVETSTTYSTLTFPTPMRAIPTITGGGSGFALAYGNVDTYAFYQTAKAAQSLQFSAEL
jgi:hypothetical protein